MRKFREIGSAGLSRCVAGYVFIAFFPYPAVLAIGSTVGLPMALLVSLPLLPFLILRMGKMGLFYIAITTSALISLSVHSIFRGGEYPGGLAVTLALVMAFSPAVVVMAARRVLRYEHLMVAVAAATLIHAGVGFMQLVEFPHGRFPLVDLFWNPSFADVGSISTEYALYVNRPMGLFPEPSAAAASLGPWIILLAGHMRSVGRGATKGLIVAAVILGTALLWMGQSVLLIFFLPLLVTAVLVPNVPEHVRGKLSTRGVAAGFVLAASASMFAYRFGASDGRLNVDANVSSRFRLEGLDAALTLWLGRGFELFWGVGPGQGGSRVSEVMGTSSSVHSVVLGQIVEFGLIAALAWVVLASALWRKNRQSSSRLAVLCWFIAVVAATGYSALAPIWVFLGFMMNGSNFEDRPCNLNTGTRRSREVAESDRVCPS